MGQIPRSIERISSVYMLSNIGVFQLLGNFFIVFQLSVQCCEFCD